MGAIHTKAQIARKGVHFRKVNAWAEVARVPGQHLRGFGKGAFIACVQVGYGNVANMKIKRLASCKVGRNPRAALAAALHGAAKATSGRSGAFAGYSKSHRKARRTARAGKRSR